AAESLVAEPGIDPVPFEQLARHLRLRRQSKRGHDERVVRGHAGMVRAVAPARLLWYGRCPMPANPPRVRFAPAPTGYLHIGGARTALFNWLWARKQKGTFILRIEDTDVARSTAESQQVIVDAMRWLGLEWNEGPEIGGPHGPYFQSKRREKYADYAKKLIAKGAAYVCTCSKAELDRLREQAAKEKRAFRYPGTCRDKGIPFG